MICHFGNELSISSSKLSAALFHSDWIFGSKKLKKVMTIFIENTKKDSKIAAFGLFHVNLNTFGRIINSAYSLFAVIKQAKK